MREPWPNTARETRVKRALKRHVAQQGGVVQLVGEAAPYAIASPFSLARCLGCKDVTPERISSAPGALFDRTSSVPRPHFRRTSKRTSSVLRAYLKLTSTAPPPHLPFGTFNFFLTSTVVLHSVDKHYLGIESTPLNFP